MLTSKVKKKNFFHQKQETILIKKKKIRKLIALMAMTSLHIIKNKDKYFLKNLYKNCDKNEKRNRSKQCIRKIKSLKVKMIEHKKILKKSVYSSVGEQQENKKFRSLNTRI